MFRTYLRLFLILLPLIERIFLQSFDHLDNPFVFRYILSHVLSYHHLATAFRTHKYLPIYLHSQPHQYTLLAKTVPTFRDYFGYLVVQVVFLMTYRAMWYELFAWKIVHGCNWYFLNSYLLYLWSEYGMRSSFILGLRSGGSILRNSM